MSDTNRHFGGVFIKTLGCKVNQAESRTLSEALLEAGAMLTPEAAAEIIVIDTCTVTAEADRKVRKYIRRAVESANCRKVLVTGCLARMDAAQAVAFGSKVEVLADKDAVRDRILDLLPASRAGSPSISSSSRVRVPIKVQDGCDAGCAYCIVPLARGSARSVPLARVMSAATRAVAAGTPEIVVTGINIGRYRDDQVDLPDLLAAIAGTGVGRVALSSIEPLDITPRLLQVMANTPSICSHLHVPLQSGCTRTLQAMGRRYTAEQYRERIDAARAAIDGLSVTTDLMCGFPGETDDDWEQSIAFCEEMGFSGMHVFRYSPRKDTRAATLPDRVDPSLAARRARGARELDARMRSSFLAAKIGRTERVCIERQREDGCYEGTTPCHSKVIFSSPAVLTPGGIVDISLTGVIEDSLRGKIVCKG
ncbi:MAG: MiaB/RimO family radical SAM methylthiotransferase [Actinobacteria bacterium]|nr:MiaB/RimO family radical SAM methylthiotransferase [Actinomycetota bacterium]MCL5887859.1 MiaB/RimO family radical SAM methylthiotransferase [Actinomycetota bacterium]